MLNSQQVLPLMPRWLDDVLKLIGSLAIKRPTAKGRAAYTRAADAMLTHYHDETASFLFSPPRATKPDEDSKPFNYLFINLLLIDIRSTYPTLLSKLNSPEYKEISRRLQADLSIVTHFIAFLVKSLGSDNDDGDDDGFELIMSADLLLTLRKNIAETVSLTIEYLRDRYDASVAGALGLHPDARAGTSATSEGTRLTLTWENMKDEIPHDRLILACLQMTSLWLREDENENLRAEAAGLTDLLTELYKESSKDGLDFRLPILTTLEATISTTQGIDAFIAHETWQPLINDCTTVAQTALLKSRVSSNDQEAQVGISIIRVLLAAVDDYAITEPPMECMFMVTVAAGLPIIDNISIACLDFEVALVQLAAALLTKASPGLRRQFRESVAALNGLTRQLKELGRRQNDQELLDSLDDVLVELEDLRH